MIFGRYNCIYRNSRQYIWKVQVRLKSWNILFFGNDDFSLFSLKELHRIWGLQTFISKLDIVTTVTTKPNPVYRYASENNLHIQPWPPVLESPSCYDVGIVVSFGHLIPKKLIDTFPLGMINVHASLLPRWRGASPIIHAIMMGDSQTGISVMRIKPHHFDTGDVIMQKLCDIDEDELMPSLHSKVGTIGASCLVEVIASLPDCLNRSVPQCDSHVTLAPRIKPESSLIKWSEQTAEQVYNLYRALYGFMVLRTCWHGQQVKIREIRRGTDITVNSQNPGTVQWIKSCQELRVHCKSGYVVVENMAVGGKRLKGVDFYNGYLSKRQPNDRVFR